MRRKRDQGTCNPNGRDRDKFQDIKFNFHHLCTAHSAMDAIPLQRIVDTVNELVCCLSQVTCDGQKYRGCVSVARHTSFMF